MASPLKAQRPSKVVASKTTRRPQFARHGTSEVASTARDKLDNQATRPQHDLRLLVGHANTLDYLMERLHARQQNRDRELEDRPKPSKQHPRRSSQDTTSGPLADIAEEPEQAASNELITDSSNDEGGNLKLSDVIAPEGTNDSSYFDIREDKGSPALSIVALLSSDSESDSSEEEEADVESVSDSDGSDDSN